MASINKTPNLNLSQYVASDKPAWLTDYNNDMSKIDAAVGHAQQDMQNMADNVMSKIDYDPQNTVKEVGGIANYVASFEKPTPILSTQETEAGYTIEDRSGIMRKVYQRCFYYTKNSGEEVGRFTIPATLEPSIELQKVYGMFWDSTGAAQSLPCPNDFTGFTRVLWWTGNGFMAGGTSVGNYGDYRVCIEYTKQ